MATKPKEDPAQYNVEIHQCQRELEELLAYMNPNAEQKRRIRQLSVKIADRALSINSYYKQAHEPI